MIDEDAVPVVIRPVRSGIQVETFSRRFEVAADHLGVDADGAAHFVHEHGDFVAAAALALDDAARVDLAVEVLVPCYPLAGPGEDGAQALDVAAVRPADVALCQGGGCDHGREGCDESGGFVDAGEHWVAHLESVHDWVAVGALVAFGGLVELVDGIDDGMVVHLAPVRTFLQLHGAGGVRSVHVSTDIHPVDVAASQTHLFGCISTVAAGCNATCNARDAVVESSLRR